METSENKQTGKYLHFKTYADQGANDREATNPIVQDLRCTKNLFGRIVVIAAKRKVDFEFLLTYPLTPVPLTLCKTDGTQVTMAHGTKSDLFATAVKATVIDGNFLLHCLPQNLPPTYDGHSRYLLHVVLSHPSKRIDILFDTYEEPTIKGNERERRVAEETVYNITGAEQIRSRNLEKALKSVSFKQQLPRFLVKDWAKQWYFACLDGRELYVGFDTECLQFKVVDKMVQVTSVPNLQCNHPEADTRICLHAINVHSACQAEGDIVIRATDTGTAVILVHHSHRLNSNVWMDVDTTGRGNRRYVNLSEIANTIGT